MTRSRDIADQQKNLGGAVSPITAGKNAVINGGFDIWQRGTTGSAPNYGADRWFNAGGNASYTQESTGSNLPSGFRYGMKMTMAATDVPYLLQAIETANSLQFAGQRVVLSYYVSSTASSNCTVRLDYSTSVDTGVQGSFTQIAPVSGHSVTQTTTSTMTRVYVAYDVPSTAKTLRLVIGSAVNITSGNSMTVTGIQLELGSIPTPFSRAGGTIQGELAACQRYFQRIGNNGGAYYMYTSATVEGTSTLWGTVPLPVTMRTTPSISATSSGNTFTILGYANVNSSVIYLDAAQSGPQSIVMGANTISGLTLRQSCYIRNLNDTSGTYISMNAEL